MTTPTDDEIDDVTGPLCIELGEGAEFCRAIYRAAHAAGQRAGMERAEHLCRLREEAYGNHENAANKFAAIAAGNCADAIRLAIKGDS